MKIAAAVAAVTAFGVTTLLVRAAHPGSAASSDSGSFPVASVTPETTFDTENDDSFFAPGSLGQADAASVPQVSSHAS